MPHNKAKLEPSICFEMTPAMLAFRRSAGDATRFLNTVLVGLSTLKASVPIRPIDLVVSWSKPATDVEWTDTREFALRGAMVSVIDGLDQYLRVLSQIDSLVAPQLNDMLNGRWIATLGRRPHLAERVGALLGHYPNIVDTEIHGAIALLAAWRNRFVHRNQTLGLSRKDTLALAAAAHFFKTQFGGVDIRAILQRFKSYQAPTLSDVSCLIACSHRFVKAIDEHLLFLQKPRTYAVALAKYLLSAGEDPPARLETMFQYGGKRSSGRILSLMLDNGGNHHPYNRRTHAPSITRRSFDGLLAIGRNKASELFGIARPIGAVRRP